MDETEIEAQALHDQRKRERAEIARLRQENERLRAALYEVTTNGRWTEGEQCGEWAISNEVYETARDELMKHEITQAGGARPPLKYSHVCPRCGSPSPALHPAVQHEGEVQVCPHPWHTRQPS